MRGGGSPRPGAFLNVGGHRVRDIGRGVARMQQQNAQRVKCPHCDLRIMPGAMHVHIDIVHGSDE